MPKQMHFGDSSIEYETIERPVKYPRLEFRTGKLMVIVPENYDNERELLEKKAAWVIRKVEEIESAKRNANRKNAAYVPERTHDELKAIAGRRAREYADKLNVVPNGIRFKTMKTKWGSCSVKGNLTFNTLLRFLPDRLVNYVVYHEVAHLVERRHNDRFWAFVEQEYPDYSGLERELLEHWFLVQEMGGGTANRTEQRMSE